MRLVMVSSLDALSRRQACASLADASPRAVVLVQDLLDDGAVVRRTFRRGAPAERVTASLEHGCPSCAVRLDLVPALERLREDGVENVVVGLPPGVPAATATRALSSLVDPPPTVESVVLACAPAAVEDQIWDGQTLAEAGCPTVDGDERTPWPPWPRAAAGCAGTSAWPWPRSTASACRGSVRGCGSRTPGRGRWSSSSIPTTRAAQPWCRRAPGRTPPCWPPPVRTSTPPR